MEINWENTIFYKLNWLPILVCIALIWLFIAQIKSCNDGRNPYHEDNKHAFYFNLDCKITAIQEPINWEEGKFRGRDMRWLLQSTRDTTKYWNFSVSDWYYCSVVDSVFFNHKVGDTLFFKYIRKERFFNLYTK